MTGLNKTLNVNEIFRSFQGEGPFTGENAIFIRLSKCNLSCKFCDTEYEAATKMSIAQIIQEVTNLSSSDPKVNFAVITGGEPLMQPLEPLCEALLACDYKIQIETNGTFFRNLEDRIQIVCSPKNVNGKFLFNEKMLARANALKFVVSKSYPGYQSVPDLGQDKNKTDIYIQPMDEGCKEKNQENLKHALDICLKSAYKISIQTHKLVGAR
jgi:7-carboxy-7-deazaguanine synthase